jgi:hypothetical protein
LDETADAQRVEIEGNARKKERGGEPTCAEFLCDGTNETVDFVEAEDDLVMIGEIPVFLLALAVVTCDDAHCSAKGLCFSRWVEGKSQKNKNKRATRDGGVASTHSH